MEDQEFKTRLSYLGRDVSYVGRKFQESVEKARVNLEATGDSKKFCSKLAQALSRFSIYTIQYAKDLVENIKQGGKEEEYEDAIKTLQDIACKQESVNLVEEKASTSKTEEYVLSQAASLHLDKDEVKEEQTSQENLDTNNEVVVLSSPESSTSTIVYHENPLSNTEELPEEHIYSQETLANSPQPLDTSAADNVNVTSTTSPHEQQDNLVEFDRETIVNSQSPLAVPLVASADESDATVANLTPPGSPENRVDEQRRDMTSSSEVFDVSVPIQANTPPRDSGSDVDFEVLTQKDAEGSVNPSETNEKLQFLKALDIEPKCSIEKPDCSAEASLSDVEEAPEQSLKFEQKKSFMRRIAEYYLRKKKENGDSDAISDQITDSLDIQEDSSRASGNPHIEDPQTTSSEEEIINETDNEDAPSPDDQEADKSESHLDVTLKADIRTIKKGLSEDTSNLPISNEPAGSSLEEEESEVTSPFKRKSVQPLSPSSSSPESDSTIIHTTNPPTSPPPNAQSDRDAEESQVVSPFKKKIVRPLSNTESSDGTDRESQVVSPYKKKTVLPLHTSDSNSDEEESHGRKRPHSDGSDNEVDFDAQTQAVSESSQDVGSDLEEATQDPKRRRLSSSSPSSGQPNQLDDDGRDDLLQMLDECAKDNGPASPIDEARLSPVNDAIETDDSEKSEPIRSHSDLDDSERDNLLNLLTDKEREEDGLQEGANELISQDRDDLLDLLNDQNKSQNMDEPDADEKSDQGGSDSETSENEKNGFTETNNKFKFTDDDRDELLDLLTQEDAVSTEEDDESSEASEDGISDDQRNKVKVKKKKKIKKMDRNTLSQLVEEFEDKIRNKDYSDADSILLDVLKEETVTDLETKNRKPEKLKDCKKRALEAYKSLLEDDEDISDLSSDMDDLEMGFFDYRARQIQSAKDDELRRRFGIGKELYVDVEEGGYCLPSSFVNNNNRSSSSSENGDDDDDHKEDDDDDDQLCDLSTILQKENNILKPKVGFKATRARSASASSSLLSDSCSDLDEDPPPTNREATVSPPSIEMASPHHSDREELDLWANNLFEDIKNSSDDDQSGFSSSSSPDEDDKKKKKKTSLPPLEGSSKKKTDSDNKESSNSSNSSSSDTDSGLKKVPDIKLDDLDSSDEDDFVAVRKDITSWRQDPLLRVNLSSSDSDGDGETKEMRAKRPKKRKSKKAKRGSNSDATTASDLDGQKTPTKKLFNSDSSTDSDLEIIDKETTPKKPITITDDDDDTPTKKGKGRRNIRALVEFEDLAEATQRAKNDEKERIRRLQERDKAMESFTQSEEFCSQLSQDEPIPLILDVHEGTQIKIHPKIVKKLKPHQREGIKFMWDSCYLSLKDLKDGFRGSGCILAHCMGLGKTLQALALIQALFTYKETNTKHVLVVCPLSTVLNWKNEYDLAYKGIKHSHVKFYTIENTKAASRRFEIVKKWWASGGVLVLGYECFGLLINDEKLEKWEKRADFRKEDILKALVEPGPDLVICDEGHLLRNKQSQRTLALNKIKTKRRIVLTGTPLQNNLLEYYYMVQFVKPDLLGNEKEYKTNFVNPITNGQFGDSTAEDIMYMKKRTHCLHKILSKTVQRVEDTELKGYLPKLIDQAVFVKLSDLQVKLYTTYLDAINSRPVVYTKSGNISHKNFLADVQILRYICLHPNVVATAEKNSKAQVKEQDVIEDNMGEDEVEEKLFSRGNWSKELLSSSETAKLESGKKLMTAIAIVKEATANGDKVLIFSQSYAEMDNLELFLKLHLNYKKSHDYYRMDGTISPEVRTHMCDKFNNNKKEHFKVFIMSTKVGGLGLNLTAANRVIIMNVNWNPSYDTQSVFRAYRFGQTKPVYVYRLIAVDTMEEKMYQRVVTKLAVAHRVVDKHQITRHYTAADYQEFYSARPCATVTRPVPNVPEDRILANIIQRYPFVFRWHEHQALLANRPEEDLDEMQKNAAWEEYEKKSTEPPPPIMQPNLQSINGQLLGQPGPSGMQNGPANNNNVPFIVKRQNHHYPDHNYSLPQSTPENPHSRTPASPNYVPRSLFKDINNTPPPASVTNTPAVTAVSSAAHPANPQFRVYRKTIRSIVQNHRNMVQNPMNLTKKTHASIVQNPAQAALQQQIKKSIGGGGATAVVQPVKTIVGPPPLVNIGTATATKTTAPPTDLPTTNQRSPLQRQVRSFMDHLHQLQKQMKNDVTATSGAIQKGPQPIIRTARTPSKMRINGVPVTRMVGNGTNPRMVKRLIPKGPLSPTKRILIPSSRAGKLPIRSVPAQLADSPLRRRMVTTSPHKVRNGVHLVRRNGQSSSQDSSASTGLNSNKENIKKRRRSLLRGFHRIAASIDLSKDDGDISLSPEMIKQFKRKGVSINYVSKGKEDDVIKLD